MEETTHKSRSNYFGQYSVNFKDGRIHSKFLKMCWQIVELNGHERPPPTPFIYKGRNGRFKRELTQVSQC